MALAAGARVPASVINAALPRYAYALSDTSRASSTTLVDAADLWVALEAESVYLWDAFLAFDAGAAGDFKAAWAAPVGAGGSWALWGLSTSSTGGIGTLNGARVDGYGDANTLTAGGSDTNGSVLAVRPAGFVQTAAAAGNLQLRFAQNSSSVIATVVKAGSWIRVIKLS